MTSERGGSELVGRGARGSGSPLPGVLLTLRSSYPHLTRTERQLAAVVESEADRVVWLSITEFADRAHVSEASIVRFCRKLGLAGFQELKLRLAQEVTGERAPESVAEESPAVRASRRVVERHRQAVGDTGALLSAAALGEAARLLMDARRIFCFGTGASQFTAMDAAYQLVRIGLPAEMFGDTHVQTMAAATLGDGDVVIGISASGSTKDTLQAVRTARDSRARVIALTNYRRSPLAEMADVLLLGAAETGPLEGGSLVGKVAQLVVLDLLVATLVLSMHARAQQAITRTAQAVLDKLL
jgi:DNA-binding MurR/RpiR family transcriptional regulator